MKTTELNMTEFALDDMDSNLDAFVSSTILFLNNDSTCTQDSYDVADSETQD